MWKIEKLVRRDRNLVGLKFPMVDRSQQVALLLNFVRQCKKLVRPDNNYPILYPGFLVSPNLVLLSHYNNQCCIARKLLQLLIGVFVRWAVVLSSK